MAETNLGGPNMRLRGYDQSSRYDPTTMSRVVDVGYDTDTDDDLDFGEVPDVRYRESGPRVLRLLLVFILVVGLAFSITIGAARFQKGGGNSSGGGMIPPDNLSKKCAPEAVSTQKGYEICEYECDAAECCRLPKSNPDSCAERDAAACETFGAYCVILSFDHNDDGKVEAQELLEVPPADPRTADYCQWDNLASTGGFIACNEACMPGNCCYENIETCKVVNPEMCDGYAPCEVLHVQEMVTIPPPLPNIAELCTPEAMDDPEGYNECKTACDPGQCCLEPIEACKVQNPEICSDYKMCELLHGKSTPKSQPTSIESQVVSKCNTGALTSPEGIQECEDICKPSLCCFASSSSSSASNRLNSESSSSSSNNCDTPENEDWCAQYWACQTLQHINDNNGINDHTDAQAAIEQACSDTSSPSGQAHCSNVCAPAHCCFDTTQSCYENGPDDLLCSHYDACGILYHNDKDPTTSVQPNPVATTNTEDQQSYFELAQYITKKCDEEVVSTPDGLDECLSLCQDNLCCFASEEESNCIQQHKELCVVYAGCNILVHQQNFNVESKATSSSNTDVVPKSNGFHEELADKCTVEHIKTQDGFANCHNVCQNHLCCFSPDPRENCYADHPLECDDYSPCAKLIHEDDGSAHYDDGESSDEYNNNGNNEDSLTQEVVGGVCNAASLQTAEGFANCHAMCSYHLCCFSPSGTKSNCLDTFGSEECLKYNACSILLMEEEEPVEMPTIPTPEEILEEDKITFVCAEDYRSTKGDGDCEMLCLDRECCYFEGPGNCKVTDKDWCDGSELCLNLNDIETNPPPSESISSECSNGGYNTAGCTAICGERSCCLQDGVDGCKDTDADWCEGYELCPPPAGDKVVDEETDSTEETFTFEDVCSMDYIMQVGESTCNDLCDERECCGENNGAGCIATPEGYCSGYGLCSNLNSVDEEEDFGVMTVCTEENIGTAEGQAECRDACDPYQCCWTMIEENDCSLKRPECAVYSEPCQKMGGILTGTSNIDDVGEPEDFLPSGYAETIKILCSETSLGTDYGLEMCREACVPHSCCFGDEVETDCGDDPNQECQTYAACTNLHDFEGKVSQVQAATEEEIQAVNMACDLANIGKYGSSQCEHHCDERACCFAKYSRHNCYDEEKSWCDEYSACKILDTLQPSNVTDTPLVPLNLQEELEVFCSEDGLAKDEGKTCLAACEPNECCYVHGAKSCYEGNEIMCSQFQICTNLFTAIP